MASDTLAYAYLTVDPANRSNRLRISGMKIHMRPFHHDMAEIDVQGVDDVDASRWSTEVPIMVEYGRTPNEPAHFYGYILGTERNWNQVNYATLAERVMRIHAIGASYPMKEDLTTVYHGLTTAQIATALAQKHYLDVDIPATPYSWPTKTASGVSEWSFLVDLAKDSGLTMHVHGTQLRMYDPTTLLRRNNTVVPVFYEKDSRKDRTVLEFRTDVTEVSSEQGRRKRTRILRGIDFMTGQAIYTTDDGSTTDQPRYGQQALPPAFSTTVTNMVARSQADAATLLPARSVENRFYIRARASLRGDVRITQSSPVVIEGLGTRDSGLWQVIEATHHYRKYWFSTECLLGRDADYDNGVRPGLPADVARARLDPYATVVFADPPTVLVNRVWRAAWASQGSNVA